MKKLLTLALAVLLVLGCMSALAEDPFASLGKFEMQVGHAQPEGNPRYVSMEKFAKDVEEKTNGHVKVTVFGNGQLGTEKEMLEQVVAGVVQGMRGGQTALFSITARTCSGRRPADTAPGHAGSRRS